MKIKTETKQFGFYGATYDGKTSSLKEFNDWTQIGSAGITAYLNQTSDETKYVEITSDGAKNGSATKVRSTIQKTFQLKSVQQADTLFQPMFSMYRAAV